jgi:hypothetical protein
MTEPLLPRRRRARRSKRQDRITPEGRKIRRVYEYVSGRDNH